MTIEEYDKNVIKFLNQLPGNVQRINRSLALTTIPLIKKRLIDQGVTGEGKSLGKYSEKPLSPGLLLNSGLGVGADKKVQNYLKQQKKASPDLPATISYKKFRELNNRPTEHVTLSFTGETLNDISIVSNVIQGSYVITEVASRNSKSKDVYNKKGKKTGTVGTGDVLDSLGDRYGDLLSLTPKEEQEIAEAFDEEIQTLIDKYL